MNKFFRITLALVAAFAASNAQAARSENCVGDFTHMPYLKFGQKVTSVEELVALMKNGGEKLHAGVSKEMLREGVKRSVAIALGHNTGAEPAMSDDEVYAILAKAKIVDQPFGKGDVFVRGINCETNASDRLVRASRQGEQFVAIPIADGKMARVVSTICANPIDDAKGFAMVGTPPATQATAPGGVVINNYNIQQVAPAARIEPIPQTGTRIEAIPQVAVAPAVAYAPQVGYGYGGVSIWPQVAFGLGVAAINAWGNRPVVVTPQANTSTWSSNYSTVYNNTTINRTGGPVLGPTGPGSTVGGPVLGNTGNFNTGRPVLGPTGAVGGGPVLR